MRSLHYWQDCFQDIQEHHGLCYHVGFNVSRGLGEGLLAHLQGLCKAATKKALGSHCSKSSFFVQKFNFDFPRKLSILMG